LTTHLIVRDRSGQPVHIPISSIPEEIRPDNWFENPDWRHRPDSGELEPLVRAFFSDEPLDQEAIAKLAQYIVDYAAFIAVGTYIFSGGRGVEYNAEVLKRLRELRGRATSKENIREMIDVGMDYALDFF